MRGNFSNLRYKKQDHYTTVDFGQGGLLTDLDINSINFINTHSARSSLTDIVGLSGTPSDAPGFTIITNERPLVDLANIPASQHEGEVEDELILARFIQNNFGYTLIEDESHLGSLDIFSKSRNSDDNGTEFKTSSVDGLHQVLIQIPDEENTNLVFMQIDGKVEYEFIFERVTDGDEGKQHEYLYTRSFRVGNGC